jgi:hypothetical protein
LLLAVVTASSFFVAEAGKCKSHPHPEYTSLLSWISDASTVISSKTGTIHSLDVTYSTDSSSSTGADDVISLDSTKKYQVWFSYTPVSDPDRD